MGFEEFSAPPGSELALPPLFGGHILESELETEVEFVSGGLGGSGLRERDEEEEAARGQHRRQRELNRRKYQALGRRCREIEQVGECGFPHFGAPWPKLPLPGLRLSACQPSPPTEGARGRTCYPHLSLHWVVAGNHRCSPTGGSLPSCSPGVLPGCAYPCPSFLLLCGPGPTY